jgi:predicted porin
MKKQLVAMAISTVLAVAAAGVNAMEVVGKKLEIYGKVHVSVDSADTDGDVTNDGLSISSNSSRIGFKGELPTGSVKFVYQLEQEVNFDDGDDGTFASRNSFVGMKGGFGKLIAGKHDTPFKTIGSKWGIFGDTIGDRRMILGASYASGNQLNERVNNSLLYEYKTDAFTLQAQYAVEPEGQSGSQDNTDENVTSVGLRGKLGGFFYGIGFESWEQHSAIGDGDATRVSLGYKFGFGSIAAIWESVDSDNNPTEWNRDVVGVNAKIKAGKGDFRVQYLQADDAEGTTDTGATNISVGYFHKLDKKMQVYAAYSATDNDTNADFKAVDGGHGDEVGGPTGGSPSAISLGMIYKF